MKKVCFKCKAEKELSLFYSHKMMKDGHLNKCIECSRNDAIENRSKNIDRIREYDRGRGNLPHRVEARMLYQNTAKGKSSVRRSQKRYIEKNPIKRAAHILLGNRVKDGSVTKPVICIDCGCSSSRLHGHHDDYAKPLDVRWLCCRCHASWHKENGEGKNAI